MPHARPSVTALPPAPHRSSLVYGGRGGRHPLPTPLAPSGPNTCSKNLWSALTFVLVQELFREDGDVESGEAVTVSTLGRQDKVAIFLGEGGRAATPPLGHPLSLGGSPQATWVRVHFTAFPLCGCPASACTHLDRALTSSQERRSSLTQRSKYLQTFLAQVSSMEEGSLPCVHSKGYS